MDPDFCKGFHMNKGVCVCVCVRACVRASVRACVRACVCACGRFVCGFYLIFLKISHENKIIWSH